MLFTFRLSFLNTPKAPTRVVRNNEGRMAGLNLRETRVTNGMLGLFKDIIHKESGELKGTAKFSSTSNSKSCLIGISS